MGFGRVGIPGFWRTPYSAIHRPHFICGAWKALCCCCSGCVAIAPWVARRWPSPAAFEYHRASAKYNSHGVCCVGEVNYCASQVRYRSTSLRSLFSWARAEMPFGMPRLCFVRVLAAAGECEWARLHAQAARCAVAAVPYARGRDAPLAGHEGRGAVGVCTPP